MIALENMKSVDAALKEWLTKFEVLYSEGNQGMVVKQESRNGPVYRVRGTTVTAFRSDFNRVSLCPNRDANPFFHFFESMWILAGRGDVEFLAEFNPRMREFSDDGVSLPAGYGFRYGQWLDHIVAVVKKDMNTRRAVIGGWDTTCDLSNMAGKDLPCNIAAHFQVMEDELDLTVFNRSNDLIWGLCGANAVQFAYILDYVAGACGLRRGVQRHVSSNTHLYASLPGQKDILGRIRQGGVQVQEVAPPHIRTLPICGRFDHGFFMAELKHWLNDMSRRPGTEFLTHVAYPMWQLWDLYKRKAPYDEILVASKMIADPVWSLAAWAWVARRMAKGER